MKIAIIVPYYTPDENTKQLFERCKASIDGRFETIFVDSMKIGLGVSAARNHGLDIAARMDLDYITFLDADDTLEPNAYDQMLAAISEAPDAPLIQMNHKRMQPNGSAYVKFFNRRGTYELDNLPSLWVCVWNKLYKSEILNDKEFETQVRFIEGLDHGEDELFVLEALAFARRVYCSERVAMTHYFDNPNSLSKTCGFTDLIDEQMNLLRFAAFHAGDASLCEAVRLREIELWSNNVYRRVFGKNLNI